MSNSITNSDDLIDSRNVISRLEELTSELEDLTNAVDEGTTALAKAHEARVAYDGPDDLKEKTAIWDECKDTLDKARQELEDWEYEDELESLKKFNETGEMESEWESGMTLIRETYFETYARQQAEDMGLISSDTAWPATCIDWEQAANELRMDYTAIEFGDTTYYCR